MPIYKGSNKTDEIYIGSTKNGKIYKGSTLVYESKIPAGTVIFESSTAGTYTATIPNTQNYYIELVGGGGSISQGFIGGGSGAYIYGTIEIPAGSYQVVVGAAGSSSSGGDTSLYNQIAGGGSAVSNGGTYTITLTGLTGVNGNNGGNFAAGKSVYDNTSSGYGAGGYVSDGIAGYAKIVTA